MVAALGIAAGMLSDVGYKALKSLVSGKSSGQANSPLSAGTASAASQAGQVLPGRTTRADLNSLFSKIDTDGDGKLSKDEFLTFKQQVDQTLSSLLKTQEQSGSGAAPSLTADASQVFNAMDTDGDGQISGAEFAAAMKHGHHAAVASQTGSDQNVAAASGASGSGSAESSAAAFLSALLGVQAQAG